MPHIVLFLVAGASRKPPLIHPFALFENLQNAPKRREGHNTENGGEEGVVNKERQATKHNAREQKYPPAPHPKIVLGFDYNGVKKADYQECGKAHNYSCEIHSKGDVKLISDTLEKVQQKVAHPSGVVDVGAVVGIGNNDHLALWYVVTNQFGMLLTD